MKTECKNLYVLGLLTVTFLFQLQGCSRSASGKRAIDPSANTPTDIEKEEIHTQSNKTLVLDNNEPSDTTDIPTSHTEAPVAMSATGASIIALVNPSEAAEKAGALELSGACQSDFACIENYEPMHEGALKEWCKDQGDGYFKVVKSCDTAIYHTACIPNNVLDTVPDRMFRATWWSGSSSCENGYTTFKDKESVNEYFLKVKQSAKMKSFPVNNKLCFATLKSDYWTIVWMGSDFQNVFLTQSSLFYVTSEDRRHGYYGVSIIDSKSTVSVDIPKDQLTINCKNNSFDPFFDDEAREKRVSVVIKEMKFYIDQNMTQEACSLAAGTIIENDVLLRPLELEVVAFEGLNKYQKNCPDKTLYGYNFTSDAFKADL